MIIDILQIWKLRLRDMRFLKSLSWAWTELGSETQPVLLQSHILASLLFPAGGSSSEAADPEKVQLCLADHQASCSLPRPCPKERPRPRWPVGSSWHPCISLSLPVSTLFLFAYASSRHFLSPKSSMCWYHARRHGTT